MEPKSVQEENEESVELVCELCLKGGIVPVLGFGFYCNVCKKNVTGKETVSVVAQLSIKTQNENSRNTRGVADGDSPGDGRVP